MKNKSKIFSIQSGFNNEIVFRSINKIEFKIPTKGLEKTILIQGVSCSYWINEIKDKNWCGMEDIYTFANILIEEYGVSYIELELQIYMIECENFIRKNISSIKKVFAGGLEYKSLIDNDEILPDYLPFITSRAHLVGEEIYNARCNWILENYS